MMARVWTLSSMDGTKKILMVDAWISYVRMINWLGMILEDGAVEFMRQPTCVKPTAQKDLAGARGGEALMHALTKKASMPQMHAAPAEEDGVTHNITLFQEKLSDVWIVTLMEDMETWLGERRYDPELYSYFDTMYSIVKTNNINQQVWDEMFAAWEAMKVHYPEKEWLHN